MCLGNICTQPLLSVVDSMGPFGRMTASRVAYRLSYGGDTPCRFLVGAILIDTKIEVAMQVMRLRRSLCHNSRAGNRSKSWYQRTS